VLSDADECCADGFKDTNGACCATNLSDASGDCCATVLDKDDACCASGVLSDADECCVTGEKDDNGDCCASTVDECGVCGGSGVLDCAGECDGSATPDCAGVCNGDGQENAANECCANGFIDGAGACCDTQLDGDVCMTPCSTNEVVTDASGIPTGFNTVNAVDCSSEDKDLDPAALCTGACDADACCVKERVARPAVPANCDLGLPIPSMLYELPNCRVAEMICLTCTLPEGVRLQAEACTDPDTPENPYHGCSAQVQTAINTCKTSYPNNDCDAVPNPCPAHQATCFVEVGATAITVGVGMEVTQCLYTKPDCKEYIDSGAAPELEPIVECGDLADLKALCPTEYDLANMPRDADNEAQMADCFPQFAFREGSSDACMAAWGKERKASMQECEPAKAACAYKDGFKGTVADAAKEEVEPSCIVDKKAKMSLDTCEPPAVEEETTPEEETNPDASSAAGYLIGAAMVSFAALFAAL
jgi:hypothetical protein